MTRLDEHFLRAAQPSTVVPQSHHTSTPWRTVALAAVGVVMLGGSVAGYFWYQSAEADRIQLAAEQQEADRAAERLARKERELDEQQRKIDELQQRLPKVTDQAEMERLRRELQVEAAKANRLRARSKYGGKGTAEPECDCKGDPLSSCL